MIKPEHFANFTDRGYQGLYNGETENQILIEPNYPGPDVRVAFIQARGVPIELMQIDRSIRPDP